MGTAFDEGDPFTIALIEMNLGGRMGGLKLAEAVRHLDPYIEIVLLSAAPDVPLKEINARIQPPERLLYVQKPFRSPELKQIAMSLCSKWDAESRVRELNATLASKVEARTSELNAANRRLRLDISKRAAVLRELQASEQRYRLLFEKDITGNFASDADGLILDCNVAFADLFGFESPQDAHGANIFKLWDTMGGAEPLRDLLQVRPRLGNHEVMFVRGGMKCHLLVNIDTVLNAEGEPEELRGYISIFQNPNALRNSFASRRRWKRSVRSRAALRMTSTTSSGSFSGMPRLSRIQLIPTPASNAASGKSPVPESVPVIWSIRS